MIDGNINNTPVRKIEASVELYNNSTRYILFTQNAGLKSITIERVGESKFFGFGICQKLNFHAIDKYRRVTDFNNAKVKFNNTSLFPTFWVSEVHRDENIGEISVTAYDIIYNDKLVNEIEITAPYTIREFAEGAAALIGASGLVIEGLDDTACFDLLFDGGANFDGSETIREALNAIAEATQTIYYINYNNALCFKRLKANSEADLVIDKEQYIKLDSGTNRRLASIVSVTELGDNVEAALEYTGTTQYVRNNPFWELREDIGDLVQNALTAVGGLTINQFNCSWRGNYLLELGDKIDIINKDNSITTSYFLNDTISYNGAYSQETMWQYEDTEGTENNPATLGEQLKQTYARVDKVNKQIDLVVSEAEANSKVIAAIQLNTDSITGTVTAVEEATKTNNEALNKELSELESKIEQTATDLTIEINNRLTTVDSVTTSTGFTFDSNGLTIEKSGSEMKTTITDDGMKVYRDNTEMLTANNQGVNAVNLHATTYLIIGNNSRFEDYKSNRTGCFWIGG